jgi:hypothetical protein
VGLLRRAMELSSFPVTGANPRRIVYLTPRTAEDEFSARVTDDQACLKGRIAEVGAGTTASGHLGGVTSSHLKRGKEHASHRMFRPCRECMTRGTNGWMLHFVYNVITIWGDSVHASRLVLCYAVLLFSAPFSVDYF